MVEILVIRHGQSAGDLLKRFEGQADYSLTELGNRQAEQLAEWVFNKFKPDRIYSSPLNRAKETAEALSRRMQMPINFDDALKEQTNGVLDGRLKEEANLQFPLPPGGWKRHEAIEGGESAIQLRARAEIAISKIMAHVDQNPDLKRICIVSHGGMITMLFRSFLNLPYDASVSIPTGDTGVHIWRYDQGDKKIVSTNLQEHLIETADKPYTN
jgi:2,3-bisphosphoglycerate-dependent phosphoglycerate mutase